MTTPRPTTQGAPAVTVRRTSPPDWEVMRELRLAALRTDPDAFGSTLERELAFEQQEWEERCANPDSYVAFLYGRPVGLGAFVPTTIAAPSHGDDATSNGPAAQGSAQVRQIVSVWMAPDARGQGVAQAVIETLVESARRQGAARLTLLVTIGNELAVRLYRRIGFRETGRTEALPGRPHLLEAEMTLDLAP